MYIIIAILAVVGLGFCLDGLRRSLSQPEEREIVEVWSRSCCTQHYVPVGNHGKRSNHVPDVPITVLAMPHLPIEYNHGQHQTWKARRARKAKCSQAHA